MNGKRVLIGALAGGVVWSIWSTIINLVIMRPVYAAAGKAGELLMHSRYGSVGFLVSWFVTLFLLSGICAWLYAAARTSRGPGLQTALKIGVFVGFAVAFPVSFLVTTWAPMTRMIPLAWLVDLWLGAMLSTLVAGWLYKDDSQATV